MAVIPVQKLPPAPSDPVPSLGVPLHPLERNGQDATDETYPVH